MKDLPPKLPDMLLFIHNEAPPKPPRTSRRREEARINRWNGFETAVGRFRAEEDRRKWEFPVEEKSGGRGLDLRLSKLAVFDIVSLSDGFCLILEKGLRFFKKKQNMTMRC